MVSAVLPSKAKPLTPKTSRLAERATSPDRAWDSSIDKDREAPTDPADPPVNPVKLEVLALAT